MDKHTRVKTRNQVRDTLKGFAKRRGKKKERKKRGKKTWCDRREASRFPGKGVTPSWEVREEL